MCFENYKIENAFQTSKCTINIQNYTISRYMYDDINVDN